MKKEKRKKMTLLNKNQNFNEIRIYRKLGAYNFRMRAALFMRNFLRFFGVSVSLSSGFFIFCGILLLSLLLIFYSLSSFLLK